MVTGDALARAVRGTGPGTFAMVMATGIVSAALRQAGLPGPAGVLLAAAAAAFVILAAASCWRAAADPGLLRAGLTGPARAFTSFALVAACGVLGDGLAAAGYPVPAAALATAALAAWLALTGLIPVRMAARRQARPLITDVNGSWYLWPVATQSLAIAAASLQGAGLLPARLAAPAAITAWLAGIIFYLAVSVLVAARLLRAGLGPRGAAAPYWVSMGAASISVLAAARILAIPGAAAAGAARTAVTAAAVVLWALATALIPVLAAVTAARCRRPLPRPRYRWQAWTVVFPLGMYATAGLQLGTDAGLPLIHRIGAVAVWPAAAAWALTLATLATSPLTASRAAPALPVTRREPAGRHASTVTTRQRCKCRALLTPLPSDENPDAVLPGPVFRAVIRTRDGRLFTGLITTADSPSPPGNSAVIVTVVAVGDNPAGCLPAGTSFALWRGHDIGRGVVTRRIFT